MEAECACISARASVLVHVLVHVLVCPVTIHDNRKCHETPLSALPVTHIHTSITNKQIHQSEKSEKSLVKSDHCASSSK